MGASFTPRRRKGPRGGSSGLPGGEVQCGAGAGPWPPCSVAGAQQPPPVNGNPASLMKTLTSISPDIPPAPPRSEDREPVPAARGCLQLPAHAGISAASRGAPGSRHRSHWNPPPRPPKLPNFPGALHPSLAQRLPKVGWAGAEAGGTSVTHSPRTAGRAFPSYFKHGSLVSMSENTHFIIFISSVRTQS